MPAMRRDFRFKQALVARQDLGMGRGKIVVQCCHASVSAAEQARTEYRDWWRAWIQEGQCKIALKVKDLDCVLKLEREAKAANLPFYLVRDQGLTQVEPGTITCLGIGPAPAEILEPLTVELRLL